MSNGFHFTLGTAAKQAGVAKSTISRAIEKGEISASKAGNGYRIDPAELDRWMNSRPAQPSGNAPVERDATPASDGLQHQIDLLKQLVESERQRAETAERDRDEWRKQAQTLAITDQTKRAQEARGGLLGWLGGRKAANG